MWTIAQNMMMCIFASTRKGKRRIRGWTLASSTSTKGIPTMDARRALPSALTPRRVVILLGIMLMACFSARGAQAAVYYVATTGSGTTCSLAAPCGSIPVGIGKLSAGDTLYLRQGIYADVLIDTSVPSGTSWANAVTISGYPGETVTLLRGNIKLFGGASTAYVVFHNLSLDCAGTECQIYLMAPVHHIRFDTVEIKNSTTSSSGAGMIAGNAPYIEFLRMKVHNAGNGNCSVHSNQGCYGFYVNGHHLLFDGLEVYDNGGNGLTLYHSGGTDVTDNIVRNSIFYNNGFNDARGLAGNGLILTSGARNTAYNNIVYGNRGSGISVNYYCDNCGVYNNTAYNNVGFGIEVGGSTGVIVRNNISYQNGSGAVSNQLVDWQGNVTQDHNLLAIPPLFTNAGAADFTLQAGSPAIDAGMALSAVTTDLRGLSRLQKAAYDIGAYMYGGTAGPGPLPRPTALRVLSVAP